MNRYLKYNFIIFFAFVIFHNSIILAPEMATDQKKEPEASVYQEKESDSVYGTSESLTIEGFDDNVFSESRKKDVTNLVDSAVKYLEKNDFGKSFNAFSYDKQFRVGELYLFVYDYNGFCLAHGQSHEYIWQNKIDYKDALGFPAVKMIIEKAKNGGGWINFQYRNANKLAYVKGVEKDGKRFVIGSGFYPLAKKDMVVSMVKNAVDNFNNSMKIGEPVQTPFGEFSYPRGRFVFGDLYIFALDFKGNIVAQGDIQGLIGTNAIDHKDETGKFINREIIEELKNKEKGVWVEYISKGAKKLTYAEQVVDREGNKYFIACGYYPETNRKMVVELVKKGYAYMTKNGLSASSKAFSSRGQKEFRSGDLFLTVYDYNGNCVAHGINRDLIGANHYNAKDEYGKYPVRMMIDKAKAGGGWFNCKVRNSYYFTYVESVEVAGIKYAIGCGIFPSSKPEIMQLIVKDAVGSIRDVGTEKSFEEFVKKDGKFVKGDLEVFTFDFTGLCYTWGSDYNMIWEDMLNVKDDDGRQYVKLIVNTAKEDSGTVVYKQNGRPKAAYVVMVEKDGKSYAVGSSFYMK